MLDRTSPSHPKRRWYWPFKQRPKPDESFYQPVPNSWPTHDEHEPVAPLKKPREKWWWISRGFAAMLFIFILLVAYLAITAPLSKSLEPIAPPQITLLTSDGQPIARNGAIVDEPVKIEKLPDHVVDAFLAIEDRRFYSHWGIDPRGLARALWNNVSGSSGTQGGSTITQQLAKLTFLTPERSLTRKAREMLIAFWMETWLTKDEILERYLSNVYFGDNIYGLRAASLHYYYRKPENLTTEQAMLLAGVVQAPSRLAPTRNPELSAKRARLVKAAMVDADFMKQDEADGLGIPKLDVRAKKSRVPTGTYFADWAMPKARDLTDMSYEKLTLTTTLDSKLQNIARRVVARAPLGDAQVALVAMRPDGEVVAMIGGKDYSQSSFNRVTQAKRQPGSTFKLFVWLAALRGGMMPDDKVNDDPITKGGYLPKNAGEKYRGEISLKEAFAKSSNVAAVRLFGEVGDDAVIREARNLGITSKLAQDDPSLALGTSTTTLLELTAAYAGVAGNRWPVTPYAFKKEEQSWSEWLFDWPGRYGTSTHGRMQDMMRYAVNKGTGRAAQLSIPNYGKTGTSQNNRDALFVGYAGDLVVGVWIGNDDNTPLKGINGGGLPARIWKDFMRQAVQGQKPASTKKPVRKPNPDGPVKPLDLPEIPDIPEIPEIPVGDSTVRIDEEDGLTVSTEIGGVPLDLNISEDGLSVEQQR